MTILQMLEQQCNFIKVPVFDDRPPEMAELRRVNLPGDFWEFYWKTDGGTGRIFYPAYRKPCTFILYGNEKMQEMKKWFLEYSTMHYEELWLLDERKVNAEEQERLRSVSADLVLPENLEVLGDYAFASTVIRSVTIPHNPEKILPL